MTEQWGSRIGFVLATLGSAVGLGNIWRFAFVTGENGGGVFILVYLLAVATLAAPLMLAEFVVGARVRADIVGAFTAPSGARRWRAVGGLMLLGSFVVLSYYVVVAGWALKYFVDAAMRFARPQTAYADFDAFIASPAEPVAWQLAFLAVTTLVVAAGVRRGIELASRWLVPLLGVLVVALAAHGMAMPGARQALDFLFAPDWSRLADPKLYIAALGQAFFSVGVGFGVLATYASYAAPRQRWTQSTAWVCIGDTSFALVASLIAFPAVLLGGLTEIAVVEALEGFRRATNALHDISFDTICGAGPNGAIVHYRASPATERVLDRARHHERASTDSCGYPPPVASWSDAKNEAPCAAR